MKANEIAMRVVREWATMPSSTYLALEEKIAEALEEYAGKDKKLDGRPAPLPPSSNGEPKGISDLGIAATIVAGVMLPITLFFFGLGLFHGMKGRDNCESRLSRIEYVMPTYRIGCWLGEVPQEP